MRLALMIEGQEDVTWDDWQNLARACEDAGIDTLFRSDHYVPLLGMEDRQVLDAWATISALAAVTTDLRLGTLVSPATFRHPSELAKVAVTADHVSGGRIELGMGAGWNEREHAAYGFPFPDVPERFGILEEQVEIVHRLWTEDTVDHDGTHYRLQDVVALPRPVQTPPPLLIGGRAGPRSVRLAARFADEYNSIGAGPDEVGARHDRLAAAWDEAGRDPADLRLSVMTGCVLGRDEAEVTDRVGHVLERVGRGDADPAAFVEERRGTWIIGTPEQAAEQIRAYADGGVTRMMLQHLAHRDLDMVALIGSDLLPTVG